jgi:chaperone modulatory protein CbpM
MTQAFDPWLTLDELCRAAGVAPEWLTERVQGGLIEAQGKEAATWRFDALIVRRVRSMREIESGYGAAPELAALVADLEDEVARLRRRLALFG